MGGVVWRACESRVLPTQEVSFLWTLETEPFLVLQQNAIESLINHRSLLLVLRGPGQLRLKYRELQGGKKADVSHVLCCLHMPKGRTEPSSQSSSLSSSVMIVNSRALSPRCAMSLFCCVGVEASPGI